MKEIGEVGLGVGGQGMLRSENGLKHREGSLKIPLGQAVASGVLKEDGDVAQTHRHVFMLDAISFLAQFQRLAVEPLGRCWPAGLLEHVGEVAQA